MKNLTVKFLKADNGDATLIRFLDENQHVRHILIDGGQYFSDYEDEIFEIYQQGYKLDLVIITHYDDDHIKGIVELVEEYYDKDFVQKIWWNSCKLIAPNHKVKCSLDEIAYRLNIRKSKKVSFDQAICLEDFVEEHSLLMNNNLVYISDNKENFKKVYSFYNVKLTLLSPTLSSLETLSKNLKRKKPSKKISASRGHIEKSNGIVKLSKVKFSPDNSIHNASSIAFIFDYQGIKGLFLADSKTKTIVQSLKNLGCSEDDPLKPDFVKVAHHGSAGNTSLEFLKLIECENFIISTNSRKHGHPKKVALARIIKANYDRNLRTNFYFNYHKESYKSHLFGIFTKRLQEKYNFTVTFTSKFETLTF